MNYLSTILLLAVIVSSFGNEQKLLNELKKKYRAISLKYHPDKQNYSKDISNILFAEVTNIYKIFMDSLKENMACNNLEIYKSLEKKYKALDKQYDNFIEENNNLVEENIELQNNIKQQNKEYNKLVKKYNKLISNYNHERR